MVCLGDVLFSTGAAKSGKLSTDTSKTLSNLDVHSAVNFWSDEVSCFEIYSVMDGDKLLDAMILKMSLGANQGCDFSAPCKTAVSNVCGCHYSDPTNVGKFASSNIQQHQGLPSAIVKIDTECSSYGKSSCRFREFENHPRGTSVHKSPIHLWIENVHNVYNDGMSAVNSKKVAKKGKLNQKRPRPGENPRPWPKDRQTIQDRVKEL